MKKDELIKVFKDTIYRVKDGEYDSKLVNNKLTSKSNLTLYENPIKLKNVLVLNEDCIESASKLAKLGKTCMLNMASYKRPGGGVINGAMAQEEELARRSNLMWGLNPSFYPLDTFEYIYTHDVSFFKDRYYQIIPDFKCDVITMAAINLNNGNNQPIKLPRSYENIMSIKISEMLSMPKKQGCKNLVLSAFGCGVFKNDPSFVAEIFKYYLEYGFASYYENIVFAILNDKNSVGSNFEIFKKILSN